MTVEHKIVQVQYLSGDNLYDSKCAVIGKFPTNDWGKIRERATGELRRLCEVSLENGVLLGIVRVEKPKGNYSLSHRSGDD